MILTPVSSKILLLCRVLLLLPLLMLPAAAFAQDTSDAAIRATASELHKATDACADRYTAQLAAAEALLRGKPSAKRRRLAHQVKLLNASGICDVVANADATAKLMGLLMVVTLQSQHWIDEAQTEQTFGDRAQSLIQAMRTLRVDIRNVTGRVLHAAQLQQLDTLILEGRRRNPHVDILSYLRFDKVASQRGTNVLDEVKSPSLFAQIAQRPS